MEKFDNDEKNDLYLFQHRKVLMKSNLLIGAKYKATTMEQKVTYIAMLKIQERQCEVKSDGIYVEIPAKEIRRRAHYSSRSGAFYNALKVAAQGMTSNSIGIIDDENHQFSFFTLINKAEYKDGVFTIRFANEFKERLIDLKENYTLLPEYAAMVVSRPQTYPLYQVLKKQCYYPSYYKGVKDNKFIVEISVAELKLIMGVVNSNATEVRKVLMGSGGSDKDYEKAVNIANNSMESMYKTWNDFNRQCLAPTIAEINEFTDILVDYHTISEGRGGKIKKIQFIVSVKNPSASQKSLDSSTSEEENTPEHIDEAQQLMIALKVSSILSVENLSPEEILSICKAADYDVPSVERAYNILKQSGTPINNITGWLITAIKKKFVSNNNVKTGSDFSYSNKNITPDYTDEIACTSSGCSSSDDFSPSDDDFNPEDGIKSLGHSTPAGKNKFNRFSQREYDFDKLEKTLLRKSNSDSAPKEETNSEGSHSSKDVEPGDEWPFI